jgi:hypothetical protein
LDKALKCVILTLQYFINAVSKENQMSDIKPVKLTAEIQWAFFDKVSDMSGKYQVDLTNLTEQAVAALEAIGVAPRKREDKPEKGWFVTVKSNNPIRPVDEKGNTITALVANGSKATALVSAYEWTWKNKKGISPSLMKIVITDLKEYNPESGGAADIDDDIL